MNDETGSGYELNFIEELMGISLFNLPSCNLASLTRLPAR
jgi:hypothetical protein